jgi:surfeit locus 1 family protein
VSRYGFLKSPLWIAGIVIALASAILFVNLGLWQLRRLDERRDMNATIAARIDDDPVRLQTALATFGTNPASLAYRRIVVEGEYATADEVMIVGKTLSGLSGHDVVTRLLFDGGTVAVNRGWVPIDSEGPPVVGAEPPAGTVELTGVLLEQQKQGSLGTPASDGAYRRLGRIDLDTLSGQWKGLLPVYLLLETQTPAGDELPVPRPLPEFDEGPHLSYAIQWFVFAAIVAIGFPILVVQNATRRGSGQSER